MPETRVVTLLREAHDHSGHWGKKGTLTKLRGHVYWPHQSTDVERYIAGCIQCARHAPAQRSQLLKPVVAEEPFHLVATDWIGPLKETPRGNKYIHQVMCYLTHFSFTRASPTDTPEDSITTFRHVFTTFTTPRTIYCDRGTHFECNEVTNALKPYGVTMIHGPSGSSKSFGLIERGNRILEDVLRKSEDDWDLALPEVTKYVNHRIIHYLGVTPAELLINARALPQPSVQTDIASAAALSAISTLQTFDGHLAAIRHHLDTSSTRREITIEKLRSHRTKMAERYNRGVRKATLHEGDLVFLHQKNTGKLEPRWRGPFRIRGYGPHDVSFTLSQLDGTKIKRTFHEDDLRRFRPREEYLAGAENPLIIKQQTIRRSRRAGKAREI